MTGTAGSERFARPARALGPATAQARLRPSVGFWVRTVLAVARRPQLWWCALVQLHRIAPVRWWTRFPFLPVPDAGYLAFRWSTAYGEGRAPVPADVVAYLRWCRERTR